MVLVSALLLSLATAADSANDTFSVSLTLTDLDAPSITVNSPANSTIGADSHLFNVTLGESGNCTLHLNGTDYVNGTSGTELTWFLTGLVEGNYSSINYTCEDSYNNSRTSSSYWLKVDTVPPVVSWDWPDINSTIYVNSTAIAADSTEEANCTLHLNGTDYANSTAGTSSSWSLSGLANGNYTTVYVTCEDSAGNDADTGTVWLYVNYTALSVTVAKSVDTVTAMTGDTLNWTITVNNTGSSPVNVTLNDSNGRNFTITDLAAGSSNTTSYTTTASCSSITNTVNATIFGSHTVTTAQSSASVLVSHCGDGICNCGEDCDSCEGDCGECEDEDEDEDEGGGIKTVYWPGYPDGDVFPPEPELVIEIGPDGAEDDLKVGDVITIIIRSQTGQPAEGEVIATRPDTSTFKERLEDGRARILLDQAGIWTFSYVTKNGFTVAKRVYVREIRPDEATDGGGMDASSTPHDGGPEATGPIGGSAMEIMAVAVLGIIVILIVLYKTGRVTEPPRRISNFLRAAKYNITKK